MAHINALWGADAKLTSVPVWYSRPCFFDGKVTDGCLDFNGEETVYAEEPENKKGKDLFTGIIALAHSLNIKVICEGVETEEQNTLVSSSACDFVQGWYYSKAVSGAEFMQLIAGKKPLHKEE